MSNTVVRFEQVGDFAAYHAACKWLDDNGYSHGSMQRDDPIGIMRGDYSIAKWRNLSPKEVSALHGRITGDKRNGPVTVTIYGW